MLTFSRFATEETLSATEVRALIESGRITATTLLQRSDSTDWKPATEFDELRSAFEVAPKPPVRAPKPLPHFTPVFHETPAPSSTLPYRFVGIWFFVLSLFAVISSCPDMMRRRDSVRWPVADATAIGGTRYQYAVNGHTYIGTYSEFLRRGAQFTVRYDPLRPEISVTNPGVEPAELLTPGVFAIFGVIGLVMIVAPGRLITIRMRGINE